MTLITCLAMRSIVLARYWTQHWQNRGWRNEVNPEYESLNHTAANTFRKRGVSVGDSVYVFSMMGGQLFLGGRMVVKRVVFMDEAVRILKTTNLYEAREHLIGDKKVGTPLNLHRRLAPALSKRLRFMSPNSAQKSLWFDSKT